MQTLYSTRSRISRKVIITSIEDYDKLEVGDLTKIMAHLGEIKVLRVYEGNINGKEAFMRQNPKNLCEIISIRGNKDSLLIINESLWIPEDTRELKIYKPGNHEYCYKMGLLMAAGLWKSLADINLTKTNTY